MQCLGAWNISADADEYVVYHTTDETTYSCVGAPSYIMC